MIVSLKQMGYSSRRPHRVPLLSAKNRKRRQQFTQEHQNCTIEDCKNVAWSDESRFLLRHSDGSVIIWRKEHESMDPSCLVSMVQAGGGVMYGYTYIFMYVCMFVHFHVCLTSVQHRRGGGGGNNKLYGVSELYSSNTFFF